MYFDSAIAEEEIRQCNKLIGNEICNYAVFLIDSNDIPKDVQLNFKKYRFKEVKNGGLLSALSDIIADTDANG